MDTQVGFINKLDVAQFRARLMDAETGIDGNTPLLEDNSPVGLDRNG